MEREVAPILYIPRKEDSKQRDDEDNGNLFDVKVTDKEVEEMKDENNDICFWKVVEFLLPRFKSDL